MINEKYDFIEEVIAEVLVNKEEKSAKTDKIDRLLTHPVLGIPVFLVIMAVVFTLTFTVGDWLKGYLKSRSRSFRTRSRCSRLSTPAS